MEQHILDSVYRKYDSKQSNIGIVRLRTIMESMNCTVHKSDERFFNDLKWYYRNLCVLNRRHKDYIEAIDIIESLCLLH